jgi:hypothetical protein
MRSHPFQLFFMPLVEGLRLGDMSKGEVLPEGVYHVRIAKAEEKIAQPSESNPDPYPYLNLDYVVTGSSPEEFHGRHVFEMCTYKPGGNFALRQVAEAAGADEDADILRWVKEGTFIDRELLVAVKVEKEGKGKDGKWYPERNRVVKRLALDA